MRNKYLIPNQLARFLAPRCFYTGKVLRLDSTGSAPNLSLLPV